MANHTATHLLHKALQDVLGDHVRQAGSAVRPDKLRFDFTHPQALTREERDEVEQRVNETVFENAPVRTFDDADRGGAQARRDDALRREVRRRVVRVVEIDGVSSELCGGTHVRSTAEIGPFAILSEGSVGSGARRIEAVTSGEAFALLHERAPRGGRAARRARARAQGGEAREAEAAAEVEVRSTSGDVLVGRGEGCDRRRAARALRPAAPAGEGGGGRRRLGRGRAGVPRRQPRRVARRTRARRDRDRARARPHIGGGGGGRPTMAQAGGKNPEESARRSPPREAARRRRAGVKVLALDYGSARTGVAVSDPTGTLARPLGVVERAAARGSTRASSSSARRRPSASSSGCPLTLRGERGEQASETERFVERSGPRSTSRSRPSTSASRPSSPARRRRRRRGRRAPPVELPRVVEQRPPVPASADRDAPHGRAGRRAPRRRRSRGGRGGRRALARLATVRSRRPPPPPTTPRRRSRSGSSSPRASRASDGRPDHRRRRIALHERGVRPTLSRPRT